MTDDVLDAQPEIEEPTPAVDLPADPAEAVEILIKVLSALIGMLPNSDLQLIGHGALKPSASNEAGGFPNGYTKSRLGAVLMCVVYKVRPVNARPPTRLPRTVGISFHTR